MIPPSEESPAITVLSGDQEGCLRSTSSIVSLRIVTASIKPASEVGAGMTNNWLNFSKKPRPSTRYQIFVVERKRIRSSSSRFFFSASSKGLRPVNTSSSSVGETIAVKAIHCPSGDHAASLTPLSIFVSLRASPPSVLISQSWFFSSSRSERNKRRLLSGAQTGFVSFLTPLVNWRGSPTACPFSSNCKR